MARWALDLPGHKLPSCQCRYEGKNEVEWEGPFSLTSVLGQNLVSGTRSGLKELTFEGLRQDYQGEKERG